ncbi:MAG: DUF190 domain-containing protein [Alphaproteobacteria bacterium]|nr:DUF190 domain-containing protein [Alphaproteobacteria bacterium]
MAQPKNAPPAPEADRPIAVHRRKKVEIVVEKVRAPAIVALIERLGATGYTVMPSLAGSGHTGLRGASEVVGVFDNVIVMAVTSEDKARAIMSGAMEVLRDYAGIVLLSDVEVARPDHF